MGKVIEETNFNNFYNKYNKKVFNYIYYKTRNETISEEIMQDSFLTLYNMIEDKKPKEEKELKNLVLAIARNILMSYSSKIKRRNNKFNENITELYEEKVVNPEELVENRESADEFYKALSKISELQREAIILVKLKGCSYKDAAKVLDKSEDEIKQLIYRAKKSLKKVLEKEYPDLISKYKKVKKLTSIIVIIISVTMLTGIVYASYKVYEHFVKNPETYTLEERDKKVDESTVNITREEASSNINGYLKALKITENYNDDDIKLIKDGLYNKTYWTLYLDNKFRIDIDAENGILVDYSDLTEKRDVSQKELSTDDILKEIDECYKLLNLNKEYKVISYYESEKSDSKILDVLYALTEDDIYNSIYVEYDITSNKIISILNISYGKQEKKVNISKDKAIDILKEYDTVNSIENIRINMGQIEKNINYYNTNEIYYDELNNTLYRNNYEVKFYWEIIYNENKNIKIDVETGEVILEGTYTVEEKE